MIVEVSAFDSAMLIVMRFGISVLAFGCACHMVMWSTDKALILFGQQKALRCWMWDNRDRINGWRHRRIRAWWKDLFR